MVRATLAALVIGWFVVGCATGDGDADADATRMSLPPTAPSDPEPPSPTAAQNEAPSSPRSANGNGRWLGSAAVASATAERDLRRPAFDGWYRELDEATRLRMVDVSWRPSCPVPLDDLRLLEVDHWDFDRRVRRGEMVVHADHAGAMVEVFGELFEARFPIERMQLIDDFGGSDDASMAANNTSGFNCRTVTAGERWSEHAYGWAIDINPVQNPYVGRDGTVLPPGAEPYVDRSQHVDGMIHADGPVVRAFERAGWSWGGEWRTLKDYHHFSATGR